MISKASSLKIPPDASTRIAFLPFANPSTALNVVAGLASAYNMVNPRLQRRGDSTWGSARVDSATILPATVTRTLPSPGEIVMGWSGPGIRISLPLLVLVSIALFTVLVKALSRHRREYWHR
jgi:hypothetical protein